MSKCFASLYKLISRLVACFICSLRNWPHRKEFACAMAVMGKEFLEEEIEESFVATDTVRCSVQGLGT